jgi:hypothetical protein
MIALIDLQISSFFDVRFFQKVSHFLSPKAHRKCRRYIAPDAIAKTQILQNIKNIKI